jgi:hypothetical protein
MRISVIGVAALALALPCSALPSADAARRDAIGKMPIIISPHAHTVLHNHFVAEASSSHERVEFVMEDGTSEVVLSANVVDGTATKTFPTWGFAGPVRVKARDCDGVACGGLRSSPSDLTVINDDLLVAQPTGPVSITAGESAVPVSVPSAGGYLKVTMEGEVVLNADGGIDASLDFAHRPNGVYEAVVRRCHPVDHSICAESAQLPAITVLRRLAPHAAADPIAPISPNGDGVRDAASRDITVLPAWAPPLAVTASWTLTDADGEVAATAPIAIPSGDRHATYRVDPLGAGYTLADGKYTLSVDASAVFDGQVIDGSFDYDDPIVVDNTAPALSHATVSARTFYPAARTGGPRSVTGSVRAPGGVTVRLDIVSAAGKVVRSVRVGEPSDGVAAFGWRGTADNGKLAPAGRYRMVWTAVDRAGNQSEPIKSPRVTLSHKRRAP